MGTLNSQARDFSLKGEVSLCDWSPVLLVCVEALYFILLCLVESKSQCHKQILSSIMIGCSNESVSFQ